MRRRADDFVQAAALLLAVPGWGASGAALRENAAVFTVPRGALPDGPNRLAVSETRARLYGDRALGPGRLGAAVEGVGTVDSSPEATVASLNPFGAGEPLESLDLTWEGGQARARVERLDWAGDAGVFHARVGRQPVGLGTSHYLGVLDILAPIAPGDLDALYKPGIDALRIRRGWGGTAEAEVIGAGADPWRAGALLLRGRACPGGWDGEAVAGVFRRRGMAGLGIEGEWRGAGLWGEAAVFERRPGDAGGDAGASLSAVGGTEWVPGTGWRMGLGVLHQGFGAKRPEDLPAVQASEPYRQGWVFIGSRDCALWTLSREFHPLVRGDLAALASADGSTAWQPRATVSLSDNAEASLYAWLGFGPRPAADGTPRSEFGALAEGAGIYLRWYL